MNFNPDKNSRASEEELPGMTALIRFTTYRNIALSSSTETRRNTYMSVPGRINQVKHSTGK